MIVKYNKSSSMERVKASFLDPTVKLTPKDEETKERCTFIFNLRLQKKYSREQAVNFFEKQYECSYSTANRIYNKAMLIFGEIDFVYVKAERHILSEQYWHLYQLALRDNDIETAGRMLDRYGKLRDVEKAESELNDGKMKANVYNIKFPREIVKALKKAINDDGVMDFNKYPDIEDAEFEPVDNEG